MMSTGCKRNPKLDSLADLYRSGLSLQKIAKKVGKSRQAVWDILRTRGIEMRPCPATGRRPKDQVVYYKGQRYTWTTKGYWRCTTAHDRRNLARRIWEDNFGPIPSGHEVFYKDGNRFNIDAENLGCLSRSDRQRERLADPNYKAMMFAYGCYARLTRSVKESLDPSRATARINKMWETRRRNTDPAESARKSNETRKARYGRSGVKDPEAVRRTLSLAHLGKPRGKRVA